MAKFIKFILFLIIIFVLMFSAGRYIYKTKYIDIINTECAKYEINLTEILSIIKAESNFNPDAVSSKNAIGLMQITLETANWCCEIMNMDYVTKSDLCVPETNIKIGVYYYNYLLDRYNNINTALAAYNAGMGNVDRWLTDEQFSKDGTNITTTPYPETNRYITKINNNIKIYKLLYKEL